MRNGLQFWGLRVAATYSCTVPHRCTSCQSFPEVHREIRHTVPKADWRIYQVSLTRNLTGVLYGWISWPGLKFSICVTVCLYLFKGQQLSKLQSMPNKIHTHRRISNIPNKLLLAWLYFETTSFHSSADSFHFLFLPLECFCKSAYKLLALNKKMLGFFCCCLDFFLKPIATGTARSLHPPGLPSES